MDIDSVKGQAWRTEIMHRIRKVPCFGTPGTISVFGESGEAILTGKSGDDVLIAASEFGDGRVVVISHDTYIEEFLNDDNVELNQLHANISKWLTRGKLGLPKVDIAGWKDFSLVPSVGSAILVWGLPGTNTGIVEELLTYVRRGGCLLLGVCTWGWMQLNPGKTLKECPHSGILLECGLFYSDRTIDQSEGGGFSVETNRAHLSNASRLLDAFRGDPDLIKEHAKLLMNLPEYVLSEYLGSKYFQVYEAVIRDLSPSDSTSTFNMFPTADKRAIGKTQFVNRYLSSKHGSHLKAPFISEFPGDFEPLSIKIKSKCVGWHSTGCYLPASKQMTITCSSVSRVEMWQIRIGAHSDELYSSYEELKRWPKVCVTCPLEEITRVSSPFGGLVYFESLTKDEIALDVKLEGVVESPFFDITRPVTVLDWNTRRTAPGLWAELAGNHVIFTLPSHSVRHLSDPTRVLELWDRVVLANHELRGTVPSRRERVVSDIQPSVGYMHAGYPVVTGLDITDPGNQALFVLNPDHLIVNGSKAGNSINWGLFHELGHNMQRSIWTPEGTGEVTNNIFTLHAAHVLTGVHPIDHPWLWEDGSVLRGLAESPEFEKWKKAPQQALAIYVQLQHAYGWDAFKTVFRNYETNMNEYEQSIGGEQDKIDLWVKCFSVTVKQNICPLYDFWGIPVSPQLRRELNGLEAFLPDDKVTQCEWSSVRLGMVMRQYPHLTRTPKPKSLASVLELSYED